MSIETAELIKAERRQVNFTFVASELQHNRIRPATYIHELIIPYWLYDELKANRIIDHEKCCKHCGKKTNLIMFVPFFEFKSERVILSFPHLYECEAFHRKIDRYLIEKYIKPYPVERKWISKMNFDNR